jgi:hypothetical protein
MLRTRVFRYRDPAGLILGLRELRRQGLTPRGLLFVALDPRGETSIAVPEDFDAIADVKVGDKLSLEPPWEGRYFHLDAIHRLPGDSVLWNGDRRLHDTGSAPEVACAIAEWLKGSSAKNVFLGCAPHTPGSWWTEDARSPVVDLHALGLVDAVVTTAGLLARRINDPALFHLDFADLAANEGPRAGWREVHRGSLGNVLLLERRIKGYRLVATCEQGLLELDVSHLPDHLVEVATVRLSSGFGVVGRVDGGAFAVTSGKVKPWGLVDLSPALLVGSPNESILDLPRALAHADLDEPTETSAPPAADPDAAADDDDGDDVPATD